MTRKRRKMDHSPYEAMTLEQWKAAQDGSAEIRRAERALLDRRIRDTKAVTAAGIGGAYVYV